MNKKNILIFFNAIVFGLIVLAVWFFGKMYLDHYKTTSTGNQENQVDQYSYLTTRDLRNMAPLPETNRIVPTGKVREYKLEAKETVWEVLPGVKTQAISYNGQTPGPVIRATEGDLVRITLKNSLKAATSIHFHGMHLPNVQDGVPPFTQKEIQPGQTFTYEFIAGHAGTYMYHPHINSVEQIDQGLYGAFIIDPQNTAGHPQYDKEYTMVLAGWNIPADTFDRSILTGTNEQDKQNMMGEMSGMSEKPGSAAAKDKNLKQGMEGMDTGAGGGMAMDYNFWTINGKAFPATEKIKVQKGDRVRIRLINISNFAHPMHLHGTDFRIIAEDSHPLAEPKIVNTIDVAPGKTFDIDFIADNPGVWVFHCHELHHTENDGVEPGGLMTTIEYEGEKKTDDSMNGMKM